MDKEVLHREISLCIQSILVGLHWKMISVGAQGSVPLEQQVKALHLFVNELDVAQAKLLLMSLYANNPEPGHKFPLHICMRLVLELDSILITKGRNKADRLHACQNMWLADKVMIIKTWEIKLLDHYNLHIKMNLRTAMMSL